MKRIVKDIFAAVGVITVCKAFCDNYEVKKKHNVDDITIPLTSTSWKSVTYVDRDEAEQILSELKEAIEKCCISADSVFDQESFVRLRKKRLPFLTRPVQTPGKASSKQIGVEKRISFPASGKRPAFLSVLHCRPEWLRSCRYYRSA